MKGFMSCYYRPHICVRVGEETEQLGDPYVNIGHGEILIPGPLGWLHEKLTRLVVSYAMWRHKKMPLHMYGITGHLTMGEFRTGMKITTKAGFGRWQWEKVNNGKRNVIASPDGRSTVTIGDG